MNKVSTIIHNRWVVVNQLLENHQNHHLLHPACFDFQEIFRVLFLL
ncbi:hypothetical protein MtrunA17_Chr2g0325511 [Medicago truncatula]|uniref:Uncharacterized protein n=1 Tax=Medicago truncatula TaxID=3880 RepID=I3SD78_MEDTR|nr:unknown [Medicago truncatula]RHN75833.1 hypothetical protein MtrunA17_Chr2g0325511 [Medicago truncatula]